MVTTAKGPHGVKGEEGMHFLKRGRRHESRIVAQGGEGKRTHQHNGPL